MPFPYIFTFYSYKGGVGRSMAVMNVAYTLAGRGRHVLVVDMDLEAPGISGFLHRSKELAEPDGAHPKDILTLLGEATRALETDGAIGQMAQSIAPVSNYIRAVAEKNLESLRPKLGTLGRLDVLGTDLDRDYLERLAQIGLKDLPQDRLIALSRLLHSYFKAQIFPHRPLGVESFELPIETHYDYVLVDSRTGITEIGGLCVGPLADRLVVITGLNDQNVQGTLDFMKEAGIEPKPRSKDDQLWDDADTVMSDGVGNGSLGPKPTILVASPTPSGEIAYKRRRLGELERLLGIRPVSLSYHPQMALMESVFVRDYREEPLAREYEELTTNVMGQIGDDPQHLVSEVGELWNEKKELASAVTCALRVASHMPEVGIAWLRHLADAAQLSKSNPVLEMRQVCATLSQNAATKLVALNNWGLILLEQAKASLREEADRFFECSASKFAEILRLRHDDPEALNNWGTVLSEQAKTKVKEGADHLFEEAYRKFAEAARLKSDYHEAFNNWGIALYYQGRTKADGEADRLFEAACTKYTEALLINPNFCEALCNWASLLDEQAKLKTGVEADRLFEKAGDKYAAALRVKPDFQGALSNWGASLINHASTKVGLDASNLLGLAREKLLAAEGIRTGSGAYNLACVDALEGNAVEAICWLQVAESAGTRIPKAKIASEKDFDRIRDEPEFASFVESLE